MGRARQEQPTNLARKLRQVRERLGLSQPQLFGRLQPSSKTLHVAHISQFELGQRIPSLLVLLAYARVGAVPVEVLIDDELELK
jgi:transcriptional regulator with XRE-family HTH domain